MFGIKSSKEPESKTCIGCGEKLGFIERKLKRFNTCPKCRALSGKGYTLEQIRHLRKMGELPPATALAYMKEHNIHFA